MTPPRYAGGTANTAAPEQAQPTSFTTPVPFYPDNEFWVDPSNGSDSNTGKAPWSAFATLAHAVATVPNKSKINLSPGTHPVSATISYDKDLHIVGGGGVRGITIVQATAAIAGPMLAQDRVVNTNGSFISGIRFDGNSLAANGLHLELVPEGSCPDTLFDVDVRDTTGYSIINNGCEDQSWINVYSETGVQIVVPLGHARIVNANLGDVGSLIRSSFSYETLSLDAVVFGTPLLIDNAANDAFRTLTLNSCWFDTDDAAYACIDHAGGGHLTSIIGVGCYFGASTQTSFIKGDIPVGADINLINPIFHWKGGVQAETGVASTGAGTVHCNPSQYVAVVGLGSFTGLLATTGTTILNDDTGWIPVTGGIGFQNGWTEQLGGGNNPPVAYRRIGKRVYLRGQISGGVDQQAAFTLPVGWRLPYFYNFFTVPKNNAFGQIGIINDGTIRPWSADAVNNYILDDISYTID